MPRAFLSHSSKDKGVVSRIFRDLGAASAIYDEASFEQGETSAAEIYKTLSNADVFVLTVSKASVDSPWVQSEIATAQQKFAGGKLRKILIFILDDTPASALPAWLRDHVYRKLGSPQLIAKAIRSALLEVALDTGVEYEFFIGRDDEVGRLKARLAKLTSATPDVIFVSGAEGIGRRTLARRALTDTYPSLSKVPVEIALAMNEADVDFYRHLLSCTQQPSVGELNAALSSYIDADQPTRTKLLIDQLGALSAQRQYVVLRGRESLQQDDGDFQPWLSQLIRNLPKRQHPQLVLISRRMVPQHRHNTYPNTYFEGLQSLSPESSKDLFSVWLKELGINPTQELLDDVVEYVSGHPKQIELAAKYMAEVGLVRINANRAEFNGMLRARALALLEHIKLTPEQERFLALFKDYHYMSAEDLMAAIDESDPVIEESLAYLQEHGILEASGNYVRLAPYLIDAVTRHKWSGEVTPFLQSVRKKFIDRLQTLETNDYVTITAIDQGMLAALRSAVPIENRLLERALLPSHMLRVARELYDAQKYEEAAELCGRALSRSFALTREAQIEAIRLQALALARRNKEEAFFACLTRLEAFAERVAKRNVAFLRGFKFRWDGKPDEAERYFREAYRHGGDHNYHVLRELAQLLAAKGDFNEADDYAARALKIAPTNAYVIDNYLEILIEKSRDDLVALVEDPDIKALFGRLHERAKVEGRCFYELRMAHYCTVLKKYDDAIDWANKAIKIDAGLIPAYLTRAKARFPLNKFEDIEDDVNIIQKLLSGPSASGDKRFSFELQRLRVKLYTAKTEYERARATVESSTELPSSVRRALRRDLAMAIAYGDVTDTKLKEWANRVLGGK